jgi:hypothetical protein
MEIVEVSCYFLLQLLNDNLNDCIILSGPQIFIHIKGASE